MNFNSQGNIARNISKVSLQPWHLEVISTSEILQGILKSGGTGRNVVCSKIPQNLLTTSFTTVSPREIFDNMLSKILDFICRKVLALGGGCSSRC